MRKLFMLLLFAMFTSVFFTGCNGTFAGHVKAGAEYHVDGKDIFCKTDIEGDTKEKEIKTDSTCSFIVTKDGKTYSCEKIELKNLNADFRFDVDCKVIIDKDTEIGEDTVLMDFKNSECSEQITTADANILMINKVKAKPVKSYTSRTGKVILPIRKGNQVHKRFDKEPEDHG